MRNVGFPRIRGGEKIAMGRVLKNCDKIAKNCEKLRKIAIKLRQFQGTVEPSQEEVLRPVWAPWTIKIENFALEKVFLGTFGMCNVMNDPNGGL